MVCYFFVYLRGIKVTKNKEIMTTQEILNSRKDNKFLFFANECAGWDSISRDGIHMITFYNLCEEIVYKRYKNEKSFAQRVSQLMKRGY